MSDYPHDAGALEDMAGQVKELTEAVVGHRIVKAELRPGVRLWRGEGLVLTLDTGREVRLTPTYDCCAFSELKSFLLDPGSVDHIITSVTTEGDYEKWYVLADMHQVLRLDLEWGEGNYPYYPFGFEIEVSEATR